MIRVAFAALIGLAVIGCSGGKTTTADSSKPPSKPSAPLDPDQALYEKVRSGAYQINAAIDAIEEVRKTTKDIASHEVGKTHDDLLKVAKSVSDAGETIADYGAEPPPLDQFKKEFAAQDDRRLKAIDAANIALDSLDDAQTILDALIKSNPPEPAKTQLTNADTALDGCSQAVEDAIKLMGGKVESDDATK